MGDWPDSLQPPHTANRHDAAGRVDVAVGLRWPEILNAYMDGNGVVLRNNVSG